MNYEIDQECVMDWAARYCGPRFHALLCDAPYEEGFMGKKWDSTGVAFNSDMWKALAAHLYPGAFLFVMAGTLNDDLISVALRDAGLRKHHKSLAWAYGSGKPKGTRIPGEQFDGHRYGGQSLKPAAENILIFQKPYEGRPVDDIALTGAGALNIDAGRIPSGDDYKAKCASVVGIERSRESRVYSPMAGERTDSYSEGGRWPSNLILLDEGAAQSLDLQSEYRSGDHKRPSKGKRKAGFGNVGADKGTSAPNSDVYEDEGGVSRYFYRIEEKLDEADPICYFAKPDRTERDEGLDSLPDRLKHRVNPGGLENDPKWAPVKAKNVHTTVKPVGLGRYLASLLLPPDQYAARRILIPFCGSGSELIGAELAGWEYAQGIEIEPLHVEIARARIDYWRRKSEGELFLAQQAASAAKIAQGSLFEAIP